MAATTPFASLAAQLAGQLMGQMGSSPVQTGQMLPTSGTAQTGGTTSQDIAAANPQIGAALAGANAPAPAARAAASKTAADLGAQTGDISQTGQTQAQQPGYGQGAVAAQAPSELGGAQGGATQPAQQVPATLTPEQAAAGTQGAQTASEQGIWNMILQNLSGRDAAGNLLTGDALRDFQYGNTLGATLASMGAAIGGDSTGGRLGQAVYQNTAGRLSASNTERQQASMNELMAAAIGALGQGRTGQTPQTSGGTPTGSQAALPGAGSQAALPGAGAQSAADPGGMSSPSGSLASLDEALNRVRRLTGSFFA